ncbi:hypothetical protein P170DRAFT_435411 [Aspergillus steynii IBT 23096]|uniref:Uncharacterized protein n=1 Tax=Aspergillus steynii IBT 23096 TaxID=1392250 RepID=A0A2I2GBF3_9EURO|nr:uncharacterized protein P170DRAFT_435411 [Aspergillus steynii IBT 23096]PLB50210.1 hypothetical protein P170DRAFT_435411 [Aspergillus steynii IBT 23096]
MEPTLNYHLGPGLDISDEARYKPCQVLSAHQVPHVVWFEDALFHYGVPTVVFDLYILVTDINQAASLLAEAGWTFDMQPPHRIGNEKVDLTVFPQQRLISPNRETRVVLLPPADWKFSLTPTTPLEHASLKNDIYTVPFPSLAGLLDALIESWLDCPNESLLIGLACHISYLYEYVPAVKERSFAENMKYEHRQFHADVLSGMETGTLPFRRHQRAIRDALVKGQYELQECSASPETHRELYSIWSERALKSDGEEQEKVDALTSAETGPDARGLSLLLFLCFCFVMIWLFAPHL